MAVPGKKLLKQISPSSIPTTSNEDLQVYCQPCDEEGPRLPAHGYCTDCKEHLCKTCFTAHKKHKLSKHHTLLDSTSMPKSLQQPSTSTNTSQADQMTTLCVYHPKEMIKFYCEDHKELLCSVCVTLEHQPTCRVNNIQEISSEIIDSIEYQVVLKAVKTLAERYQKKLESIKKMTTKSNSSLQNVLVDIRKFRQDINDRLDELERQAVDVAKAITQDNTSNENLKTIETICEDMTKLLKTTSDTIKQLNTSKQANKLFMELKLAEKKLREAEDKTVQLTSYDVKEHNFKPNEAILTQLKKVKSLGKLTKKSLNKESATEPVPVEFRAASYHEKINVKTSDVEYRSYITGMTLLTPELLIITDHSNMVIKMVDINSESVTGQLQLNTAPWDITAVTVTDLAVTHPDKNKIQFLSISTNKLIKKCSIRVDGECWGISYHHGKLVVTFCKPAKLQVLDINGTKLREIDGKGIFKFPWHVTCNSSSIYVSDWYMTTVTRINWQGKVMSRYRGINTPEGLSLSDDGTVFVCDRGKNVIEETAVDSSAEIVLEYLKGPNTVCWCRDSKMLYYSSYTSDDKFDDFIHIYKLSQTCAKF